MFLVKKNYGIFQPTLFPINIKLLYFRQCWWNPWWCHLSWQWEPIGGGKTAGYSLLPVSCQTGQGNTKEREKKQDHSSVCFPKLIWWRMLLQPPINTFCLLEQVRLSIAIIIQKGIHQSEMCYKMSRPTLQKTLECENLWRVCFAERGRCSQLGITAAMAKK